MLKHFYQPILSVTGFTVTLATIGTVVSLIAGLLTAIYTGLKIYEWFKKKKSWQ